MKKCINCGTSIEDDALFCEECGAKQDIPANETVNTDDQKSASTASSPSNTSNKDTVRGCLIMVIALILLIFTVSFAIKSCSSSDSLEDVARDFTEAMVIDFNAKKTVSLMSQDLIDSYMNNMGFSSEKKLIKRLGETLKVRKEDTIGYYGDDWRAKIIEVEIVKQAEDTAIVVVSVSHKGSDALWDTNIDDWRIYLKKENGKWRVYDFQG